MTHDAEALRGVTGFAGPAARDAAAWLNRFAPLFTEMEARSSDIGARNTLLNMDVRSDNLLFRLDGTTAIVDWPGACRGPGLIDAVFFIQSVAAEGGPDPEQMLSWYDHATYRQTPTDTLSIVLAAVSGFFAARACLPDIPGLPRLRQWQRVQLDSSLQWLCRLLDLPPSPGLSANQT